MKVAVAIVLIALFAVVAAQRNSFDLGATLQGRNLGVNANYGRTFNGGNFNVGGGYQTGSGFNANAGYNRAWNNGRTSLGATAGWQQRGGVSAGLTFKHSWDAEEEEEADRINWEKIFGYVEKAKNIYDILKKREDFDEEADAEFFKKIGSFFKKYITPENIQKGLDIYRTVKGGDDDEEEADSEAGDITVAQLKSIIPTLKDAKANQVIGYLNSAMRAGGITSCPRQAAFIAQLAHESGGLQWFEEFASGQAYEGRKDLGNTQPGDGKRYKGRGPIQLTGRANYRAAGRALGLDLEGNPTQVATPAVGFRTAVWFWGTKSLNSYADQNTQSAFDSITKRINGGYNGKADRDKYWKKAKSVLGC